MSINSKIFASTEIVRLVHFGMHSIEVGEWPDDPEYIEIRTTDEKNVEYFGELNLVLPPAAAMELGRALVAAATERGIT